MPVTLIRGDARSLPMADNSVDLIVTSPPYWALRSYTDGGEHYAGQIGAEPTPAAFIDSLIDCTREWMRVLKPTGSLWVNLGDKYAGNVGTTSGHRGKRQTELNGFGETKRENFARSFRSQPNRSGVASKSLIGLPWRYAIRCIDDLGLILRAEVIWSKPNGLPESVTDRVRRSHETWFHFVRSPRYFAAVDAIREPASDYARPRNADRTPPPGNRPRAMADSVNPLGRLSGSVREVPTRPLKVPAELGVDHFAAFPMEWPRWIIRGWSPSGICTACGEGRRPVVHTPSPVGIIDACRCDDISAGARAVSATSELRLSGGPRQKWRAENPTVLLGEACACPDTSAPTRPAVVLDPFGGTGTTALVAHALGRHGISVDMSADYCRLARWRTSDPGQLAAALEVEKPKPQATGQMDLFEATS